MQSHKALIVKKSGFTLIELMITVVIIGILAAVAYPSYTEYVRKGRRAEAKTALLTAAQQMEKYFSENMSYAGANAIADKIIPGGVQYYTVDFEADPTANAFSLEAVPTGAQADDKCGTYKINHLGNQTVTDGTLTAADCW